MGEAVGLGGSGEGETDQGEREAFEAQGRLRGLGTSAGKARTTMETLKEMDGGWAWVQALALRREPRRREAGEVAALIRLAWCAYVLARLHSCSKFTTPGSYYSNISKYSTLYVATFPLS